MFKTYTARELLEKWVRILLTILAVSILAKYGIVERIMPDFADITYKVIDTILQASVYIVLFGGLALGILYTRDYIKNRGKPKPPSPELEAINNMSTRMDENFALLIEEIRQLRQDFKS